jgi:predicted ArsR family transcriptional regulator
MQQLPYLERVKIQSEILLPLYKRLREELGNERAAALLRAAVKEYGTALGASVAQAVPAQGLDKVRALMPMFSAGNALDVEPLVDDAKEFSLNVRGCRYADYFRALGEPEFGAMITCEVDPPMMEAMSTDVRMERTQTIAGGASHCDFRWKATP